MVEGLPNCRTHASLGVPNAPHRWPWSSSWTQALPLIHKQISFGSKKWFLLPAATSQGLHGRAILSERVDTALLNPPDPHLPSFLLC